VLFPSPTQQHIVQTTPKAYKKENAGTRDMDSTSSREKRGNKNISCDSSAALLLLLYLSGCISSDLALRFLEVSIKDNENEMLGDLFQQHAW
jgi:hypothetical protein